MKPSPISSAGAATWRAAQASAFIAVHLLLVPVLLAVAAWTLRHSALDLRMSNLFFDSAQNAFGWRESAWLNLLGHEAARGIPFIVGAAAFAGSLAGQFVERLRPWRVVLLCLGLSMVLGPLIVDRLKYFAAAHCPHDLAMYGGAIDYATDLGRPFLVAHGQGGSCVPSGHAGGGYAMLSLYFAGWAAGRPSWRWSGLAIGIATGLLFSLVRVMQGAHFASQTLWSASIDWTVAALVFMPLLCGRFELPAVPKPRAA
jgi:membrane-associated PAP2 superfamily phosphatase